MYHIKGARRVANKWVKTAALSGDEKISKYLPETRTFTSKNLKEMLERYGMVVIKPRVGSGGQGVIQVIKADNTYRYRYYQRTKSFAKFTALLAALNQLRKGKSYIIQRGIYLATINGRPIDYRVKIQKPHQKWFITGMVGRLARKGLFVTNLCRGGDRLTLKQGLKRSLPQMNINRKRNEMRKITFRGTKLLETKFPGVRQLGFDYGLDKSGNIWMFEVNTKPQ